MKKSDKVAGIISFGFLGALVAFIFIREAIIKDRWADPNLEKKYTIGTVTDYEPGAKTPPSFIFDYKVRNRKLKGNYAIVDDMGLLGYDKLKRLINKRFYVKYIEKHPKYSRLLIYRPVPDSIQTAPKKGWKRLPTDRLVNYK